MSPQALPNGLPPWAQLHACLDSLDAEVLTVGSCTSSGHCQLIENRDQTPFPRGNLRVCEQRKYKGSCEHKTLYSLLFTAQDVQFSALS